MASSLLLSASSPLRTLASQARFSPGPLRILVAKNDYYVQHECVVALRALGHRVIDLPLGARGRGLPPSEAIGRTLRACVQYRPDFLLSINLTGFDRAMWLHELCEAMALPVAMYFVDSPFLLATGHMPPTAHTHVFVWDRSYVPILRRLGAAHVSHLPLASCLATMGGASALPSPPLTYGFVGHSLHILIEHWASLCRPEEHALAERWADALLARRQALHELVAQPAKPLDRRVLALGLANYQASAQHRLRHLQALHEPALHVFGDAGFQHALPLATHPGTCVYGAQTARIYRHTAVNLNVTNAQMPDGLNQRVFDAPAAGAFLLTDAQPELQACFEPEVEMATFCSPEQMRDKARFFAMRPQAREAMVHKARRRVQAEHTYTHRMRRLVQTMRDHYEQIRTCAPTSGSLHA